RVEQPRHYLMTAVARAQCAPVNPTLPLVPFLPLPREREAGRKHNQKIGTARANVARPHRCSAAAPVFRPAHLTVGQAATRPLSVPGQRLTGVAVLRDDRPAGI